MAENLFDDLVQEEESGQFGGVFDDLVPAAQAQRGSGVTGTLARGFNRLQQASSIVANQLGAISNERAAERLARDEADIARYPVSPETQAGLDEISHAQGLLPSARAIFRNPKAVGSVIGESIVSSIAPLASAIVGTGAGVLAGGAAGSVIPGLGTAAGAAGGGAVGLAGGAGLGSFAVEFASTISNSMRESGVDMRNPDAVVAAFSNPEIMAKARERGVKRGIPIAIFDALSFGLAGKLAGPASRLAGRVGAGVKGRAVVGGGAEIGAQALTGSGGEAAAQLVETGRVGAPGEVLLEGIAEIFTGAPEIAVGAWRAKPAHEIADGVTNLMAQTLKDTAAPPKAAPEVAAQPEPVVEPQPVPEAQQQAPEPVARLHGELKGLDLALPLDGEESVTITDDDGKETPGFWHRATNKAREVGKPPHQAVIDLQPKPKAENIVLPNKPETAKDVDDRNIVLPVGAPQQNNVPARNEAEPKIVPPFLLPDEGVPQDELLPPAISGPNQQTGGGIGGRIDADNQGAAPGQGQAPQIVPGNEGQAGGPPKLDQVDAGGNQVPVPVNTPRPDIERRPIEAGTARAVSGTKVDVEYAIVEADSLVASHDDAGGENQSYPAELQPRDRTRKASEEQISDIAQKPRPEELDKSPKASDGAPIISSDGVVESGNGRIIGLRRGYVTGKAEIYRKHLADKGYPVEGMKAPILVRIRKTEMTPAQREQWTRDANERDNLAMSSTEQAMADSRAISDEALNLWRGGDVDAAGNRDFVRAFIKAAVGKNDQTTMIAADGSMSQQAVQRVRSALLGKAYGDPDLIATLIEATDNDIKTIGGALMDTAAGWAKMRGAARTGQINPAADSTQHLLAAVKLVQQARRDETKLGMLVNQTDIFSGTTVNPLVEGYLELFFQDTKDWIKPVGRDKLVVALNYAIEQSMKTSPGVDLLGAAPVDLADILKLARQKLERLYGDEQGQKPADLFAGRKPAGDADTRKGDSAPGKPGTGPETRAPEKGEGEGAGRRGDGEGEQKPADDDDIDDIFNKALDDVFGVEKKAEPLPPPARVEARKQTNGKFKLFYIGTQNEVFQDKTFESSADARGYLKAQLSPEKAATPKTKGVTQKSGGISGKSAPAESTLEDSITWLNANLPTGYTARKEGGGGIRVENPETYFGVEVWKGSSNFKASDLNRFIRDAKEDAAKQAPQAATKKPAAPKPTLSLDDVAKGIKNILGEEAAAFDNPNVLREEIDPIYQKLLPFLKAGASQSTGDSIADRISSLVKFLVSNGMDRATIQKLQPHVVRFMRDVQAGKESLDVPSGPGNLEPDSGEPAPQDEVGAADVPAPGGRDDGGAGTRGSQDGETAGRKPDAGGGVPESDAADGGKPRNNEIPDPEPEPVLGPPADRQPGASGDDSFGGLFPDATPPKTIVGASSKGRSAVERREAQKQAEKIPVKDGLQNIRDTLPMLHPMQQEDVEKVERRFEKSSGMMLTNGTGTGKTYSALGVIKRFVRKGKKNILIVAPSQGILEAWADAGVNLGLDLKTLADTQDAGRGIVMTTYANMASNRHIADRDWDLVVADEAHSLSSNAQGDTTQNLRHFRAITQHPQALEQRAKMQMRAEYDAFDKKYTDEKGRLVPGDEAGAAYVALNEKMKGLAAKWSGKPRPKALMMSATPFAHHFSLDYAEGYLYDYPKVEDRGGYNQPSPRDQFYIQNLGYRKRYGKLTTPDANVDIGIMERQLNEKFKKEGALSGRTLEVEKDYDRKFVLVHDMAGANIDRAFDWLRDQKGPGYYELAQYYAKKFDYLHRARLLEAMKARASIDYIKKNLALGRKVMVFHNYNEGGGFEVFPPVTENIEIHGSTPDGKPVTVNLADIYAEFLAANPYIEKMNFGDYQAPMYELKKAFGDLAGIYNGTVSKKTRSESLAKFNQKDSKLDILIVQADAGSAGLSAHDTVGDSQRILVNLGLPTKPTAAIQQEGRIFRDGQASDAMFRYLNTGTSWERHTFASTIAQRASTAENLGMGDLARTLRRSFIDAYHDSAEYNPGFEGEGTGGKETDKAARQTMTTFQRAKTHYWAQQKKSGKRDQREGSDYFATPEPLGVKMVEWADIKPGDKVLEPSAGHGAIARYFPETADVTIVEPSDFLMGNAMLNVPGARYEQTSFENLNIVNKYDVIVMNPPFGVGGKTAMEHLGKAFKHLRNGGRVVAILPSGPAADKRMEKLMDMGKERDDFTIVQVIELPAVTFERSGTKAMTIVAIFEKHTDRDVGAVGRGRDTDADLTGADTIEKFFDRIENLDVPKRIEPKTKEVDYPEEGDIKIGDVDVRLRFSKTGGAPMEVVISGFLGGNYQHVMALTSKHGGRRDSDKRGLVINFLGKEARDRFLTDWQANPEAAPEPEAADTGAPVEFTQATAFNKMRGKNQYVATIKDRVSSTRYKEILAVAKANGGHYSSFKGQGAVPGFQFDTQDQRAKFLADTTKKADEPLAVPESGDGLAEQVKRDLIEAGRKTGHEYLTVINRAGQIELEITDGEPDSVNFTEGLMQLLRDPENDLVLHHNHPSSSSLSPRDIAQLAYPGLNAAYAHGHNGLSFAAKLAPALKIGRKLEIGEVVALQKIFNHWARTAKDKVHHFFQTMVTAKKLTIPDAVQHEAHVANMVLDKGGMIVYHSGLDDRIASMPEVAELVDRLAKQLSEQVKEHIDGRTKNHGRDSGRAEPVRHAGDLGEFFEEGRGAAGKLSRQKGTGRRGENGGFREEESSLAEESGSFEEPPPDRWHVPHRGTFAYLRNQNLAVMSRIKKGFTAEAMTVAFDKVRVAFQDRFLPMLRTEQKIEEVTGTELPEEMKVYLAEELYSGRAGARLDKIQRRYMEPIGYVMRQAGLTQEDVGEYLYARHAPERNARIAEINERFPDGGSGMMTAEANDIVARLEGGANGTDYKTIGRMIDRMLRESMRTRVERGLLSQETADAWQEYEHYVPLRGFEEIDEDAEAGLPNVGKGYSVRGPESKQALGRKSKAGDILATSFSVAQEAVIRGEKNRVVQRLYDLARAHPNKDVWRIDPVEMKQYFNRATGMVYRRAVPAQNPESTVGVKFNGVEHRIVILEPRLREAIRRLNVEDIGGMLRFMISFNRYLSTMNTSLNPEFVISNAIRDIQTAIVHMEVKEIDGLTKDVLKDYRSAMAGAWGGMRGKPMTTEWRKWFDEFNMAGGKVAFYKLEGIDDLRNKFDAIARQMSAKDYRTVLRGGKALFKFVEDMNLSVDNAVRLALYKNLRERGVSQDQAASASKNLTVNFNRRGQHSTAANAMYLFFNASVQGPAIMLNALRHKRGQKIAAGMVGFSFALTMLNALFLSDDDENGEKEYDKIPEWEKERNLILMLPMRSEGGAQSYIKFPLPYGYNVFHTVGRVGGDYALGKKGGAEALGNIGTAFVDAFNPVGGSDSILKLLSPTITDPLVEINANKDFAGKRIRPELTKYDKHMPFSQDYYNSVSPPSRHLAAMLNDWTGGNEFKPGKIDLSPEWIDHAGKFLGGAAVATWWRPVNAVMKMARGEEITSNDVPFARRVVGKTGSFYDRGIFYDRVDEIGSASNQVEGFRKKGDRASYEALDEQTKALGALNTKEYRKLLENMKDLQKTRNETYAGPLTAAERLARLKRIEEAEMRLIQTFNRGYLRALKRSEN